MKTTHPKLSETLIPENIKKDVSIYGVVGTYEGGWGWWVVISDEFIRCDLPPNPNPWGSVLNPNATLTPQVNIILYWFSLHKSGRQDGTITAGGKTFGVYSGTGVWDGRIDYTFDTPILIGAGVPFSITSSWFYADTWRSCSWNDGVINITWTWSPWTRGFANYRYRTLTFT